MGILGVALFLALGGGNPSPAGAHDEDGQLRNVEEGVAADPADRGARLCLAELYRLVGRFREARRELAALETEGFSEDVRLPLAAYYLDIGAPDSALALLDTPDLGDRSSSPAWGLRGEALEALGDVRGALEAYDRRLMLEEAPGPDLFLRRAELALRLGRDGRYDALKGLEAARRRIGRVASLECRAAELEADHGDVDAALSRLDGVRSQLGKAAWLMRRADLLARGGRPLEAQATYTEALEAISAVPLRRRTPAILRLEEKARAALGAPPSTAVRGERR